MQIRFEEGQLVREGDVLAVIDPRPFQNELEQAQAQLQQAEAQLASAKDNLARYKTPRDVVFLDELPRNPTGKVHKRELAARPDA